MAARFWVGGTGIWNASNTANWSATTGGAGGASVPGPADDVTFNGASGTNFTVTIESGYNPSVISVTGGAATVTLDINSQTLTVQTFSFTNPTSVTRTIAFGSTGQITVTGNNASVFTIQTDTGLTTSGSRNVVFTYSGGVGTRTIGTSTFGSLNTSSLNYRVTGGTDTVTFGGASGIIVRSLDLTGFSGTFTTNVVRAAGNVTLSPTMTLTAVPTTWHFSGSAGATQTFTTAGLTLPVGITISTTGGGTVVFADDVTIPATATVSGTLTLTSGTLNLGNNTANVGLFSSTNSTARVLAFGANSTLNIAANSTTVWNTAISTNFSYTGNARVNLTANAVSGIREIQSGQTGGSEATKPPPFYVAATGSDTISTAVGAQLTDLVFLGNTVGLQNFARRFYGNLILTNGMPLGNGSGTQTFAANSVTQILDSANNLLDFPITFGTAANTNSTVQLANNTTIGTTRTVTLTSGTLDLNGKTLELGILQNSGNSVRAINQNGGTFNITGSNLTVLNLSNSTNFSYPTPLTINFTYSGNVGTRRIANTTAGGTANNAVNFNFTAGSDTIDLGVVNVRDANFVGFTGTLTNQIRSFYGNLTLGPGMTATSGANATTFNGVSSNQTLTTNGVTTSFPITIFSTNSNFVLSEPLSIPGWSLTVDQGNLIANGHNIAAGGFSSSNGNPRIINISNVTVTLNSTGVPWNMTTTTGATLIATNSNINLTSTADANNTFAGGGFTYGNLDIGGATGGGNLTFTGNNTFAGAITSSKTVAYGIKFTAGTTTTVGGFDVSGSAGNLITITSATAAVHNLVLTGGSNVDVSYADISYSNASPSDSWYALLTNNNTDSGNNTGWIFTTGSPANSNFFLVF
jgi:hypothetical protein